MRLNRFLRAPERSTQRAPERSGIIAAIYKLLYICDKSIARLYQFTFKKLQISFMQNAETLID